MTLEFPEAPTLGQRTTTVGRTYEWNGEAWDLVGSGIAGPPGPLGPTGPNGGVYVDVPNDNVLYARRNGQWIDIAGESNLQFRRGTAAELAAIIPLAAEPVWATDTKRLYVGDGGATGGIPVGNYPLVGASAQFFSGATGAQPGSIWVSADVDRSSISVVGQTFVAGGSRGRGAVDFTTIRTASTEIASGLYALAGPGTNTASARYSVALAGATGAGEAAFAFGGTASATNAIAWHGTADVAGMMAHGAVTTLNGSLGRGQAVQVGLRWQTSNATPAYLRRHGSVQGYPIAQNVALFGTVQICAIQASTGVEAAHYVRKFAIKNTAGTTALIGTPSTIGTDEETSAGLDVAIEANNTNDTLDIKVTGLASTTLRWIAIIQGVEQAF